MTTDLKLELIENVIKRSESKEAFFVGDPDQVTYLYKKWIEFLPQVTPYYAVKCNPDPNLIKQLCKFPNIGFDCATISEMSMVMQESVDPSRIIYSNPSRQANHLAYAAKAGIKLMSFDSETELMKIHKLIPDAQLVLRISVQEMGSTYSFKGKYGVNLSDAKKLMHICKSLGMNMVGLCFHVGCSAKNPKAYYYAIKDCKQLFTYAKEELNYELYFLDLGGGYSSCFEGCSPGLGLPFERVASSINSALEKFFPLDEHSGGKLQIIAEPGRYFSQSVYSLCVSIFNKKKYSGPQQIMSTDRDLNCDRIMYYINQGYYSGFSCIFWDGKAPYPDTLYIKGKYIKFNENLPETINSTLWGPTCDGADCVFQNIQLPEMELDDWMIWNNIGAYSSSIITSFNGFSPAEIIWLEKESN